MTEPACAPSRPFGRYHEGRPDYDGGGGLRKAALHLCLYPRAGAPGTATRFVPAVAVLVEVDGLDGAAGGPHVFWRLSANAAGKKTDFGRIDIAGQGRKESCQRINGQHSPPSSSSRAATCPRATPWPAVRAPTPLRRSERRCRWRNAARRARLGWCACMYVHSS